MGHLRNTCEHVQQSGVDANKILVIAVVFLREKKKLSG